MSRRGLLAALLVILALAAAAWLRAPIGPEPAPPSTTVCHTGRCS